MSALLCPKCGNALKWACDKEEGEAYCSALQSRILFEFRNEPTCDFEGKVRRVSPSEVVLVSRGGKRVG